MSDTDSPLRISVCPEEGSGLDVVVLDVCQELPLEIERRGEDPASDAIPLQLAEPQFQTIPTLIPFHDNSLPGPNPALDKGLGPISR